MMMMMMMNKKSSSVFAEMMPYFLALVLVFSAASAGIQGQPTVKGFISIDCGLSSNQSYNDDITNIPYTSDDQFIETGENHKISKRYLSYAVYAQESTLRSFPDGARNCYSLKPVVQWQKYLVRASFLYGDYDGQNSASAAKPLQFDLHLGVNLWQTVNISDPTFVVRAEAFTVAEADFLSVCLVNIGVGVPFVSALELRPLKETIYPFYNETRPVALGDRLNMGANDTVRYPNDLYDRIWRPIHQPKWRSLSTLSPISYQSDDLFAAPAAVLQTAVTPADNSTILELMSIDDNGNTDFYFTVYFTEVVLLPENATREFDIVFNGKVVLSSLKSPYLTSYYAYTPDAFTGYTEYNFVLNATSNSTLPPIMNGLEVYTGLQLTEIATDTNDVDAIMAIKVEYRLEKNWQGDPCAPKKYAWDGLQCKYNYSAQRIISMFIKYKNCSLAAAYLDPSNVLRPDNSPNQTSNTPSRPDDLPNSNIQYALIHYGGILFGRNVSSSGLIGEFSVSFGLLNATENLDLSYNNLTGKVPDFLGDMLSLKVLNLTGNNFSGPIPSSLLKRSEEGSLVLRFSNNTKDDTSPEVVTKGKKKISTTIIIIISAAAAVVLLVLLILPLLWLATRRKEVMAPSYVAPRAEVNMVHRTERPENTLPLDSWQFTYARVEKITNNFGQVIGKGAFGTVYLGRLENGTLVAVKVHSPSTSQPTHEFVSEVKNLTRIHHRNLVSLLGYCKDGNHTALVYEYMPQGSLKDHLQERGHLSRPLSWRDRLRIALDAAQGLEYLHRGCLPKIIHRDVKSSNILLGNRLNAKLTDYGLSKSFSHNIDVTQLDMAGTPGYVDPEFHNTFQLTEKSDIYSFGVVLLELITGQRAIQPGRRKIHVVQLVAPNLAGGNIGAIIDPRLEGSYNENSMWKVADLAMKCTADVSSLRPAITEVVVLLKETLEIETVHDHNTAQSEDANFSQPSSFDLDHGRESIPSAR